YADWRDRETGQKSFLCPYPTIAQTLRAVANKQADLAVVPVENLIHGSVAMTLDTLWQLEGLNIQKALVLPIVNALISRSLALESIKTVYSHPQALAQCQNWLNQYLPSVQQIASNSTTEALEHLGDDATGAAISSQRAARLYNLPILAEDINDYRGNCTRFWVIGWPKAESGGYVSLAFSVPANVPGALMKPLQVFAKRNINLSRIESRPTKRSLGEYLFFIDLESDRDRVNAALVELHQYVEVLKIFGRYDLYAIKDGKIVSPSSSNAGTLNF
ncbi:prephenate dehydratase, partial [Spirulina sp. 06S082]|uniref:prephenate dehydratase n=1 Tax=Spirulina sp. 06S082 TaxID=3110248 RepID=UPI002B21CE86